MLKKLRNPICQLCLNQGLNVCVFAYTRTYFIYRWPSLILIENVEKLLVQVRMASKSLFYSSYVFHRRLHCLWDLLAILCWRETFGLDFRLRTGRSGLR